MVTRTFIELEEPIEPMTSLFIRRNQKMDIFVFKLVCWVETFVFGLLVSMVSLC